MQESLEMTGATLPAEFGLGCLTITNSQRWRLTHFVWEGTATEVGATFFCKPAGAWDEISLLRIEVYRLPAGKAAFQEQLEWYTRDRKTRPVKLTDGVRFEPAHLAMLGLGEGWEEEAFALSKAEVIRIYRSQKFAINFRFLARSGPLLTHPLFRSLVKNIRFEPKQWEKGVPALVEKARKPRVKESAIPAEHWREIEQGIASATKRLAVGKIRDAEKRLAKVEADILKIRADKKLSTEQQADLAVELGALAGKLLCTELDWEWCRLKEGKGKETICVCSPDRRLALAPLVWIWELIKDKKRELNCVLLFNLIKAGRFPPSRPKSYLPIG